MVCSWLSGDVFKTVYFIIREAPLQVWAGSSYLMIDVYSFRALVCILRIASGFCGHGDPDTSIRVLWKQEDPAFAQGGRVVDWAVCLARLQIGTINIPTRISACRVVLCQPDSHR